MMRARMHRRAHTHTGVEMMAHIAWRTCGGLGCSLTGVWVRASKWWAHTESIYGICWVSCFTHSVSHTLSHTHPYLVSHTLSILSHTHPYHVSHTLRMRLRLGGLHRSEWYYHVFHPLYLLYTCLSCSIHVNLYIYKDKDTCNVNNENNSRWG